MNEKNEKLASAVEALQEELVSKMQEVAETKKMINALRKRMGEEPLYMDVDTPDAGGTTRPDMYYGKPLSTAARMFLERRKTACLADDIMKGLQAGGFDFSSLNWKENDRLRLLAVTLGKNSQTFHRLPNGTVGLLEWYPTVVKKEKSEKEEGKAENGNEKKAPEAASEK